MLMVTIILLHKCTNDNRSKHVNNSFKIMTIFITIAMIVLILRIMVMTTPILRLGSGYRFGLATGLARLGTTSSGGTTSHNGVGVVVVVSVVVFAVALVVVADDGWCICFSCRCC